MTFSGAPRTRPQRQSWARPELAFAFVLFGCAGEPPATTFLMMGTESLFSAQGRPGSVTLRLLSSSDGGDSWAGVEGPNGPCTATVPLDNAVQFNCARADIAPALSNSPTQYVAAWWGQINYLSLIHI